MSNICQIYVNIDLCIVGAGTKTLVVHGQNECDIPTQLPVHEDTQFEALLKVRTPGTRRYSDPLLLLLQHCRNTPLRPAEVSSAKCT